MSRPPRSDPFTENHAVAWEPVVEGVERQILGYDGHLMLVRLRFAAGAVGALHQHPNRQVSYVVSGAFDVTLGGETRTLRAGDTFFAAPEVPHGLVAREASVLVDVFSPAREDFLT